MDTNACTPLTEQLAENTQAVRNEASWPKVRVKARRARTAITTPDHGRKGGETSSSSTTADGSTTIDSERLALCEVFSIDKRTGARQPFSVFEGNLMHLIREIERAVDELGAGTWVSAERVWLDSPTAAAIADHGTKGGSSSSGAAPAGPYAGIDYGMGRSNIDHATGIRYGVVSQHSLCQEALNDSLEADYGDPSCPECGGEVLSADKVKHSDLWVRRMDRDGAHGCFDYACLACRQGFDSEFVRPDEPIGHSYTGGGYELVDCLDSDVMVIKSPYYTRAQFCSPCVPGAGNLDNPCPRGPRTFCLGAEWFDDGRAPYPIWRVSDDSVVAPGAEEGE